MNETGCWDGNKGNNLGGKDAKMMGSKIMNAERTGKDTERDGRGGVDA